MSSLRVQDIPALRLSVLFAAGIIIGKASGIPIHLLIGGVSILFVVVLSAYVVSRRYPPATVLLTSSVVLLCVSAGAAKISVDRERSWLVSDNLMNRPVIVIGTVSEPPTVVHNGMRFVLTARELIADSCNTPLREQVLVTVKWSRRDTLRPHLEYGMSVALKGKLSRPSAERNPGEFSAREYYEANGIPLFLFVPGSDGMMILDSSGGWWVMRELVAPVRAYTIRSINRTVGGEEAEFLKGILIGERSGISSSTRRAFANSGVAHVLAVSGSNVAIVATTLFFGFEFLRLPRRGRVLAICAGLLFYMLLTGTQPPVVRATVMAILLLTGQLVQEKGNVYNALGVAALILLGIDSRQLFDVGFQLSFVAVFSIVFLYPTMNSWISRIAGEGIWHRIFRGTLRVCAVSGAAALGTLPLTAIYFGRVSLIGVITNIVVIPSVAVSVTLGFVSILAGIISTWMAETYAPLNLLILRYTLSLIDFAAGVRFAYVDLVRFTVVDAVPFYIGLLLVFHCTVQPLARRLFILLLIALNVAVFYPPPRAFSSGDGKLRMSFIEVGQGDAIFVELPDGANMLIDAGPKILDYDAGERIVVPFLKRQGVSRIDFLVVSHPHSDHMGGIPSVLKEFDVKHIFDCGQPVRSSVYREYLHAVREEGCTFKSIGGGTVLLDSSEIRLYVLHPNPRFINLDTTYQHPNLNNVSVVFKLQYGKITFLLSGDAEQEAEEQVVSAYGNFLKSTLLKVGHHGGATSTSETFLDAVRPVFAVISVGINNKFQHPSLAVLRRLREMNVDISRTDEDGAVMFETDGTTLTEIDWR